jgi:type VI secretion system Hcp family effector
MAFDAFLDFPKPGLGSPNGLIKVVGESQDPVHKTTVKLSSFAFDLENTTTIGSATGGAGAGKTKLNPLKVTKTVDAASPSLFTALGTGAHFPEAVMYIRKSGGSTSGADYLIYRFSMVFITHVEWSASTGDDAPEETVEMVYGAMQVSYAQQLSTGQLAKPTLAAWSQLTNSTDYVVPTT